MVVFVVVLEAKNAQNKTEDKVFQAKQLKKVIAERENTFAAAFGRPIAKIDGKSPEAFTGEKPTEPKSNVGRNVGIALAVILVAIVLVVILYLYM